MSNTKKIAVVVLCFGTIALGFSIHQPKQPETLPLIPMMQKLLVDMQKVNYGIYIENYQSIEEGAAGIADHPEMTAEDKQLVKKTLGEAIKQFVDFDMTVHHHADSMRMAATEENMQAILQHYKIVQQGCVDCHSHFRDRISNARKQQ